MAVSEEECSNAKSRSSSPSASSNSAHYLAKCVLRGSVVLQVVYGHFRSPSSNDIVFGKETSIELVIIGEDGILQSICEQPVFGTIKDLAVIPWNEKFCTRSPQMHGKDLLAVTSDSGKLSFLIFCNEMHRFFPLTHIQLSNSGNSIRQLGRLLAVDTSGCFIATSAYVDRLALFSLSITGSSDIIDEQIFYPPESEGHTSFTRSIQRPNISGTIWSICFISRDLSQSSKEHNPVLAIILNRSSELLNELLLLEWNIRGHTINVIPNVEAGPIHDIVEVPHSNGFAFLFRVGDALLMDLRDAHHPCRVCKTSFSFLPAAMEEQNFVEDSCRVHDVDDDSLFNVAACALLQLQDYDPMCIDSEGGSVKSTSKYVCSWSWEPEPDKNPKMIFCIDTGEFFMIEISFDSEDLRVNLSDCVYKGLPSKSLLWVEGGFLAALVEMGDGIVLKVENDRLRYASPIQNIAPILDMSVVDHHDEKQEQMFGCCGVAPEGSLRIIRSGISVEKLLRTAPIYQGVTGTWALRMKVTDLYHSFVVLSFVEETRVLSVGVSFADVTDSAGFLPNVCTLACGLVGDGLLVQIHQTAVRLCLPTQVAHAEVEVLCFVPDEGLRVLARGTISLTNTLGTAISGCVPQDVRLVLVDRLYVLSGLRNGMLLRFEWPSSSSSSISSMEIPYYGYPIDSCMTNACSGLSTTTAVFPESQTCSVDLTGGAMDGPPINLQLIATRRIGVTPVFLVPLTDSLDADMIALSDRPWLLQTARHGLSYTSISFQPSTHSTPVCSVECPKGLLFVAENSLHLVEMVHSKRLNVQKFHLGGTPRKVLYHSESRLLLVMRTELSNDTCSSDICCVDPLSGSVVSSFKLEHGETGKSMELVRVGTEQVLVVGTSLSSGPAIMPSGEAESTKGRLIVLCLEHLQSSDSGSMTFCSKAGSSSQRTSPFCEVVGYTAEQLSSSSLCSSPDDSCDGVKLEESEAWQLRLAYATKWPGMALTICPYLDRYFLASAGSAFYVCGFPNDNPQRVRKFAIARTRFTIISLTAHFTRIAVGDCRDGILFYSYHEDTRKLEQVYCDPSQRLVADCILLDVDTAVVSDRKGSIAVLSCSGDSERNASPECNLTLTCAYYMGEIAMSIRKGSFSYRLPADDMLMGYDAVTPNNYASHNTIMASTLLGSIIIFIPLTREEHELLEAVQARLVVHPLTAPILGNDHSEFRSRENPVRKHCLVLN
ncbi:spliceosomal protein sap, putative [Ricinus communis]|uniref:Spliceosomal protein sap, putative n=1 Tax=Ricinus communis TaxID=3988 RepID=B9T017_RICCO|nr:spliceosomal protein sap, putative [Ricinus communis]